MRIRVHLCWLIAAVAWESSAFAQDQKPPPEEPPQKEAPPQEETPPSPQVDERRPCDRNFMNACPEGQECIDARCTPKKRLRPIEEQADVVREPALSDRGLRLGVQNSFLIGFAGRFHNPKPAYSVALDFGFPTGKSARWHVEIGYLDLNGYTGLKFNPFILGYAIPLLRKPVKLELEVIAAIVQSEVLFGNGYAIALSSGLRTQLVASYGVGFIAFAPIGFEIRYAYGTEEIGIDTGVGANWPMQLIVGVEL